MRLTKIYTKVGDKGQTLLATGVKVPKDSLRIEAYGTVDELNSFLGLLRDSLDSLGTAFVDLVASVALIQNEMHDLGGELATPLEALNLERQQVVSVREITRLESEMDGFNEKLAPLANFVLPGGHAANSTAHICRTVCRRAERLVVTLGREEPLRDDVRIYLNRLSDWLFVLSRVISQRLGLAEILWVQRGRLSDKSPGDPGKPR